MNHLPPSFVAPSSRHCRAGISLLEVLVACGILTVGLASVAAILPAAGARLSQASIVDRAGVMAANACAEIRNRGLVDSSLFGTGTTRACVFGEMLPFATTSASSVLVTGTAVPPRYPALPIDPTRGFQLEDDLVYTPPISGNAPVNAFVNGTSGFREFRPGVCWGAMLTPATGTAAPGAIATLSIAVFKKPGNASNLKMLTLTGTGVPMFQYTTGGNNGLIDEADRKRLLPGCSYLLALPNTGLSGSAARWVRINSSWTAPDPSAPTTPTRQRSYVVLDLLPLGSATAGIISSSGTMNVIAFENLLRLDEYPVSLD